MIDYKKYIVSGKLKVFHFPTVCCPLDVKIYCPQSRSILYLYIFHQHTEEICSMGKVWPDINVLSHLIL